MDEFLLILAEAARCGLHITDPPCPVASWARLFARDPQEVESQLGIPLKSRYSPLRGMEIHERTNRPFGLPQRLFPLWAFGKDGGVPLSHI